MKKILLFLSLILLSFFVYAAGNEHYTIYYGTLTLQSSNVAAGQTVSATIDGTAAGSATTTTIGEYKLLVTLPEGSSSGAYITFTLSTPSGYSSIDSLSNHARYSTANDGKYVNLDLSFTGTATAAAAAAAAGAVGRGGGVIGAAPVTPEALTKITDLTTVSDVIGSLPEGWTNVDVYQVGTATTETVKETLTTVVENALKHATETEAISILQTIQNKLIAGEISQVSITKTLNVYKITNKDNGESVYRSKVTLTFTAPKDLTDVKIVEVIPYSIVSSVDEIYFPGIKPEVLQKNPILQWTFDFVKKDETKSMDYIIKKKIDKIESITVASATEKIEKPPFPLPSKTVIGIMIIVVIVLIGLVIYYYYLRKKEVK